MTVMAKNFMSKALIEIFCLCFIEDGLLLCISCHSLLYLLVLRQVCEQEMLINGRLTICSAVELFVSDGDLRINICFSGRWACVGLQFPVWWEFCSFWPSRLMCLI